MSHLIICDLLKPKDTGARDTVKGEINGDQDTVLTIQNFDPLIAAATWEIMGNCGFVSPPSDPFTLLPAPANASIGKTMHAVDPKVWRQTRAHRSMASDMLICVDHSRFHMF